MSSVATDILSSRGVRAVVRGQATSDGAGVSLVRLFPSAEMDMLDPFLLFDSFKSNNPDDYIASFPPHPHRGFQTVTYLLHGRMRHKDSAGHEGVLRSGGVQWMSAGSGVQHSEMPEQEEGLLAGFQLWVNLPAAQKMGPPRYQEFEPEQIPCEESGDGTVIRVIAGVTVCGTVGPIRDDTLDPIYFDVTLPAGGSFHQPIPPGHNAFVKMIDGRLAVDHEELVPGSLAVLGEGEQLEADAREEGARFLLIAGRPVGEPVARSGPFVMNTDDELRQAYADYRDGKFGDVE